MGIFTMWTYDNLLLDFLMWLIVGAVTCWIMVNLCYVFFGSRGRARMNRAVLNALLVRNLRRLYLPPLLSFIAGGFQGFRVQLSASNREVECDNPPSGEVREMPEIHHPSVVAMSEEEINALPVSKYRPISSVSEITSEQGCSSSALEKASTGGWDKCRICLDFLSDGDLVRILACGHQFHANCVDPWLERQALCPVCKISTMEGFGMDVSSSLGQYDRGMV